MNTSRHVKMVFYRSVPVNLHMVPFTVIQSHTTSNTNAHHIVTIPKGHGHEDLAAGQLYCDKIVHVPLPHGRGWTSI